MFTRAMQGTNQISGSKLFLNRFQPVTCTFPSSKCQGKASSDVLELHHPERLVQRSNGLRMPFAQSWWGSDATCDCEGCIASLTDQT